MEVSLDQLGASAVDRSDFESSARIEEFARLLGEVQRPLLVYLVGLLHDHNAADDVLQETNLVLWREFESFTPGTNFTAWACRIAFNRMRAWRKNQRRERLRFSDGFLDAVAEELDGRASDIAGRLAALEDCVRELPDHHRQLVRHRYLDRRSIDDIAARTARSADSVYRMLARIRSALVNCIHRKMALRESNEHS